MEHVIIVLNLRRIVTALQAFQLTWPHHSNHHTLQTAQNDDALMDHCLWISDEQHRACRQSDALTAAGNA